MIKPEALFQEACESLFGSMYAHRSMAEALDCRVDQVKHWAAGRRPIPDSIWGEVAGLLADEAARLAALKSKCLYVGNIVEGD